jgi:hypothetical protein
MVREGPASAQSATIVSASVFDESGLHISIEMERDFGAVNGTIEIARR